MRIVSTLIHSDAAQQNEVLLFIASECLDIELRFNPRPRVRGDRILALFSVQRFKENAYRHERGRKTIYLLKLADLKFRLLNAGGPRLLKLSEDLLGHNRYWRPHALRAVSSSLLKNRTANCLPRVLFHQ